MSIHRLQKEISRFSTTRQAASWGAHGLKLRSFWHGVRSCFCPESVLQYTRNFIAMSPPLGSLGLSSRASVFASKPANIFQSDGYEENNERTAGCRVAGMQRICVYRQRGLEGEGETSPDPIQSVLPQVIEATNRVLISNGDLDMSIIADGTLWLFEHDLGRGTRLPVSTQYFHCHYSS
jgi:hypothetical protein